MIIQKCDAPLWGECIPVPAADHKAISETPAMRDKKIGAFGVAYIKVIDIRKQIKTEELA